MESETASKPGKLVIWGVALIAAVWLGATAAGAVLVEAAPNFAVSLFPKNGFAYQSRALRAEAANTSPFDDGITPSQLSDAREALRREPLASVALTMIGLASDAQGKRDTALRLIAGAHTIDKREIVANTWLIGHYGKVPGRSDQVLTLLDEALRIRPELTEQYMPAFAQALTNSDTIPVFEQLLREKPVWEMGFWRAVTTSDAALPNAEVLRARILAGAEEPGEIDSMLMAAFVRAKRMDLALRYAASLPELAEDHDNLIRNSSFTATPSMPPLDWELGNDGRMSAAVDEGRGTLDVNAIAGSSGTAARQLVALPPGAYVLLVKLARADFARGSDLTVRLHCAESDDQAIPSLSVKVPGDTEHSFVVADDSRCRFYWVDLVFSALDSSGPVSTGIAEVRIVRARTGQSTEAPGVVTDGSAPE